MELANEKCGSFPELMGLKKFSGEGWIGKNRGIETRGGGFMGKRTQKSVRGIVAKKEKHLGIGEKKKKESSN